MTTARPASHPEPVPHESVAHRVPAPLRPLVAAVTGYRHEPRRRPGAAQLGVWRWHAGLPPRRWLAEEQMLGTDGG